MTTAQVIFSIALGVIALIILWFAIYVLGTTVWGNRWVRKSDGSQKQPVQGQSGE